MYARDFNLNTSGEFILKFKNLPIQNSAFNLRFIYQNIIEKYQSTRENRDTIL